MGDGDLPRDREPEAAAALVPAARRVEPGEALEDAVPVVDGTLDILGEPTEAERRVSPDVEKVLGRPARSFARWAEENLAAFR